MTTVIVAKDDHGVYGIADGLDDAGHTGRVKIVKYGDMIVGFAGWWSLASLAKLYIQDLEKENVFLDPTDLRDFWNWRKGLVEIIRSTDLVGGSEEPSLDIVIGRQDCIASMSLGGYIVTEPFTEKDWFAIGSGCQIATGAMDALWTLDYSDMPVRLEIAMNAARRHDKDTGGNIAQLQTLKAQAPLLHVLTEVDVPEPETLALV